MPKRLTALGGVWAGCGHRGPAQLLLDLVDANLLRVGRCDGAKVMRWCKDEKVRRGTCQGMGQETPKGPGLQGSGRAGSRQQAEGPAHRLVAT